MDIERYDLDSSFKKDKTKRKLGFFRKTTSKKLDLDNSEISVTPSLISPKGKIKFSRKGSFFEPDNDSFKKVVEKKKSKKKVKWIELKEIILF